MSDKDILPTEEPDTPSLQGLTNPPHRILVVDDEVSIRQLITSALVGSGYRVDAAEDGADAWEALQVNHYDLLITDNNMPKVSGVQLLQKLHATRHALPVIMATGTLPKEEFARKPWLAPAATLLKPYTLADLLKTVKAVLRALGGSREQIEPGQARRQPMDSNFDGHPIADTPQPGPNFIFETE
jgi:two-component system chemotaxis response regulator CheY